MSQADVEDMIKEAAALIRQRSPNLPCSIGRASAAGVQFVLGSEGDTDGDNHINYEEFVLMMCGGGRLLPSTAP